jgi:hypothetical protein
MASYHSEYALIAATATLARASSGRAVNLGVFLQPNLPRIVVDRLLFVAEHYQQK